MTKPGYEMIWSEAVPEIKEEGVEVKVITGSWNDVKAPDSPQASWANKEENEVAIYIIRIKKGHSIEIPTFSREVNRMLYHIDGDATDVEGSKLKQKHGMQLRPDLPIKLEAKEGDTRVLLLRKTNL